MSLCIWSPLLNLFVFHLSFKPVDSNLRVHTLHHSCIYSFQHAIEHASWKGLSQTMISVMLIGLYVNISKPDVTHTETQHHRGCALQEIMWIKMCLHLNGDTYSGVKTVFTHLSHNTSFQVEVLEDTMNTPINAKKHQTGYDLCATMKCVILLRWNLIKMCSAVNL